MYYIRFADLLTDVDVVELEVPFKLDRRIIQPGTFSCDIDIPNSRIGTKVANIIPQKTIAHVYRDSTILGSYVIWTKDLSGSGSNVKASFQGASLESLFYHSYLSSDLSYTGEDQLAIAEDLVIQAQIGFAPYAANSNYSISVAPYTLSGVTRDRSYPFADAKSMGDILEDLSNVDAGFEYVVHTTQDGTSRPRVMHFAYDKFEFPSSFVIEEPGGIASWKISYDGLSGGTIFWARGQTSASGSGQNNVPTVSSPAFASNYLDAGWPALGVIADYQNASIVSTLDKYAAWWAANRSGSVMIPTYEVDARYMFSHGFSPFSLGFSIIPILNNPAFPLSSSGAPSFNSQSRIIGFELSVDGAEKESMSLVTEASFDPTEVV